MAHKVGDGPACKIARNATKHGRTGATHFRAATPDVPNQTPVPQLSKQMLNLCYRPPTHIIVRLLAGKDPFFLPMNGTMT